MGATLGIQAEMGWVLEFGHFLGQVTEALWGQVNLCGDTGLIGGVLGLELQLGLFPECPHRPRCTHFSSGQMASGHIADCFQRLGFQQLVRA